MLGRSRGDVQDASTTRCAIGLRCRYRSIIGLCRCHFVLHSRSIAHKTPKQKRSLGKLAPQCAHEPEEPSSGCIAE